VLSDEKHQQLQVASARASVQAAFKGVLPESGVETCNQAAPFSNVSSDSNSHVI
jgi:hypothetical protein